MASTVHLNEEICMPAERVPFLNVVFLAGSGGCMNLARRAWIGQTRESSRNVPIIESTAVVPKGVLIGRKTKAIRPRATNLHIYHVMTKHWR